MTMVAASGQIEVVKVTARAANVLTAVRAQEGTTAIAFAAGDRAELRATAAVFTALQADIAAGDAGLSAGLGALQGEVTALEAEVDTKASQAAVDAKLDTSSNDYVHATGGDIDLNFTGAKPALAKNGTSYGDLATEAFVTAAIAAAIAGVASVPVGSILPYAGGSVPTGFLLPYGQAVSRSTYAALFAAIGTTHGAGDGSTTFNLPDLRGRVPAGVDAMGGTAANRLTNAGSAGVAGTLGATGGAEQHTLTTSQIPSHDHGGSTGNAGAHTPAGTIVGAGAHAHGVNWGGAAQALTTDTSTGAGRNVGATTTSNGYPIVTDTEANHTHTFTGTAVGNHAHTVTAQGGGQAHNNVQPTLVVNWMIKT